MSRVGPSVCPTHDRYASGRKGQANAPKPTSKMRRCWRVFGAVPGTARQPVAHVALAAEVNELDSLLQRRRDLEQMVQQEKNRIEALQGRPGIAPPVIVNLKRVIQALEEALQEVEAAIAAHQQQHIHLHQDAQRLLALPGVV